MTHGSPKGTLDQCPGASLLCKDLFQALSSAGPRMPRLGAFRKTIACEWWAGSLERVKYMAMAQMPRKSLRAGRNRISRDGEAFAADGQQPLTPNAAIMDSLNEIYECPSRLASCHNDAAHRH